MKIVEITTFVVGNPNERKGGKDWLFVKLVTDEGIVGYGECNAVMQRQKTLVQMIKDFGDMYVLGADPFKIELLWETLYSGGLHYFRHPGMISTQAIAGIEMACWDIIGKATKQPVYNLLGGKINEKLRSYTYLVSYVDWLQSIYDRDTPENYARAARQCLDDGFNAIKIDPSMPENPAPRNLSLEELHYAENCVAAIRKEVGDKMDILIGTHGQFCTHTAITYAKLMEPYLPLWFEEPVPPENIDEMARVAQHTTIPIATGERLITIYEYQPLLAKQAAQIIQVHVGVNGILESKKIAGMAQAHYAQIAPWMYCGPIAFAAAVHLGACSPNFLIQECIGKCDGFDKEIVKDYIEWKDGYIIPPNRPGLGVELNEEVLEKYPEKPNYKMINRK